MSEHPPFKQVFETELDTNALRHLALLPAGETPDGEVFYNDNVLVRRTPAPHHLSPPLTGPEAEQCICDTQAHFAVLEDPKAAAHIFVPSTYFQAGQPDSEGFIPIESISERVYGHPFNMNIWHFLDYESEEITAAIQLADTLVRYYTWVLTSGETVFLSDIPSPIQFWVTPEGAALVDTDPIMRSLDTGEGWSILEASIMVLEVWAERIPHDLTVMRLERDMSRLQALCSRQQAIFERSIQNTNR